MRVHFCLVAWHKNRTAEGNSQGTMRGQGAAIVTREPQEYPVSFGRMCILRPPFTRAISVNLARARFGAPRIRLSNFYGFGSHAHPSSFSQEADLLFSPFLPTIYQKRIKCNKSCNFNSARVV